MQIPQSSIDGAKSHYETQRQQSLAAYEQQQGLPTKKSLLTRLYRWLYKHIDGNLRDEYGTFLGRLAIIMAVTQIKEKVKWTAQWINRRFGFLVDRVRTGSERLQ